MAKLTKQTIQTKVRPDWYLDTIKRYDDHINNNSVNTNDSITFRYAKTSFKNVNFRGLYLHLISFIDCTFEDCDFNYANLSSSDLTRAKFTNCSFYNTNLSNSRCVEAEFDNSDISEAIVNGAIFKTEQEIDDVMTAGIRANWHILKRLLNL